jgi:hydrogenase maturation protein HypF
MSSGGHANIDSKIEIDLKNFLISILDNLLILNKSNDSQKYDELALQFHLNLVMCSRNFARDLKSHEVFLTGGVFQNRLLTELMKQELEAINCKVHIHNLIPPNDGGISAGQILFGLKS